MRVVYMQTFEDLRHIYKIEVSLTENEQKTLQELISLKTGSAYSIQKKSELKHYSTALRSLKKLEEKGCIIARTEISGARGKRLYSPTMLGKVSYYLSKNEKKQIINLFKQNSDKFRDMLNAEREDIDNWVYKIASGIIWNFRAYKLKKEKIETIDEILLDYIQDFFLERMLGLDQDAIEEIKEISKIEWIRKIAIKVMAKQLEWQEKQNEMSKKLITELEKLYD